MVPTLDYLETWGGLLVFAFEASGITGFFARQPEVISLLGAMLVGYPFDPVLRTIHVDSKSYTLNPLLQTLNPKIPKPYNPKASQPLKPETLKL